MMDDKTFRELRVEDKIHTYVILVRKNEGIKPFPSYNCTCKYNTKNGLKYVVSE
jgi:hypothetical protein